MSFNFKEFAEVEEADILDWWTDNKLPHPGCPISFKLVQNLCYVCHRSDEAIRSRKIKETIGVVQFHYTNRDQAFFYFPFKDRCVCVPLDSSQLDVNFTFLAAMYGRYGAEVPQGVISYPA